MPAKTTLVTGSGSGIGTALCQQLCAKGHDLVLVNRSAEKGARQAEALTRAFPGRRIESLVADMADLTSIRAVADKIAKTHPVIDTLFLNAGLLQPGLVMSRDGIEQHFAVNCVAPALLTRLLRPQLAAAHGAAVVVSGSAARNMARNLAVAELVKPAANTGISGPYAQSKQALRAAFDRMGREMRRDGIRLDVLDLMPTRTGMAKSKAMPLAFRLARPFFQAPTKAARQLIALSETADVKAPRNLPEPAQQDALMKLLGDILG